MKEQSEFGKGLVVNLVKFAEHFSGRMLRDCYHVNHWLLQNEEERKKQIPNPSVEMFQRVYLKTAQEFSLGKGTPEQEALSSMIELWANGATDHLYEITVPKQWEKRKIAKTIRKLQDFGLKMGHSFPRKRLYTVEDIQKMWMMVKKIAVFIDKELDVDSDWGRW